jgi:hypothetical protein
VSQAKPLHHIERVGNYASQNSQVPNYVTLEGLTPRQRRRANHKLREKMRETSRHGRLRRRFDRKDNRQVKAEARKAFELTRFLLDRARGKR